MNALYVFAVGTPAEILPWRNLAPESFNCVFSTKSDIWMYGEFLCSFWAASVCGVCEWESVDKAVLFWTEHSYCTRSPLLTYTVTECSLAHSGFTRSGLAHNNRLLLSAAFVSERVLISLYVRLPIHWLLCTYVYPHVLSLTHSLSARVNIWQLWPPSKYKNEM